MNRVKAGVKNTAVTEGIPDRCGAGAEYGGAADRAVLDFIAANAPKLGKPNDTAHPATFQSRMGKSGMGYVRCPYVEYEARTRVEAELRLRQTDAAPRLWDCDCLSHFLIVLVFGIIDFGLLVNANVIVANAARDAARTASLGGTEADIRAQAAAGLTSLSAAGLAHVTVTVSCQKPAALARCTHRRQW